LEAFRFNVTAKPGVVYPVRQEAIKGEHSKAFEPEREHRETSQPTENLRDYRALEKIPASQRYRVFDREECPGYKRVL
jgi:hypothetical protein